MVFQARVFRALLVMSDRPFAVDRVRPHVSCHCVLTCVLKLEECHCVGVPGTCFLCLPLLMMSDSLLLTASGPMCPAIVFCLM